LSSGHITTTRPFLRWAGSKRKILNILSEFYPAGSRYVEPFAGSACLFFALQPHKAILGDLNIGLVDTLRVVRDDVEELLHLLDTFRPSKTRYYQIRDSTAPDSAVQQAARFIYLNRNCFNGLYRTNKEGKFNVPYGGSKCGAMPSADEFRACANALRCAHLVAGDFEETLSLVEEGDFVYMDPPYSVDTRRVFREYGAEAFCFLDVLRLEDSLDRLDRIGATFLVSYADSHAARLLARKYSSRVVHVRRNISGFYKARRIARELLITNVS
jgi:DNA adenine methylase